LRNLGSFPTTLFWEIGNMTLSSLWKWWWDGRDERRNADLLSWLWTHR